MEEEKLKLLKNAINLYWVVLRQDGDLDKKNLYFYMTEDLRELLGGVELLD